MFRNPQLARLLSPVHGEEIETFFLLGLEGDDPDPNFSIGQRVIDTLVKTFQPSPVLTHVELLLPPASHRDESHFSTYLGRNAAYGSSFANSRDFYLGPGNIGSWRAIPVQGPQALKCARQVCSNEVNTPYSLSRYVFSVPPGRAFAGLLPDHTGSPAHCAALSARIIRDSIPLYSLTHYPPWYSPSTLYLEASKPSRMAEYHSYLTETTPTVTSVAEEEEISGTLETLLRGSDAAVQALTHRACQAAINKITRQVVEQRATADDCVKERILEKQLGRALLRWVELVRDGSGVLAGRSLPPANAAGFLL